MPDRARHEVLADLASTVRASLEAASTGTTSHALAETFGVSPEVWREGLRAEADAWTASALTALFAELPSGWPTRVPARVLVIAARTLPASAWRQCGLARALGAEVRLKTAAGQEALGEVLAASLGVVPTPFASDDTLAVAQAVGEVDAVIVLGSDETVAAVGRRVTPSQAFAPHGHRVSAIWVAAPPTDAEVAALGRDLLAWDQAGCLSPQCVWVEGDDQARETLAARLAAALPSLEAALPLADRPAHFAGRRHAETLSAMLGAPSFASETALCATHPSPALRVAEGPRILWFLPADRDALAETLPVLSTLAVIGAPTLDLPTSVRVCRPGEMQRPPLDWRQDGLHPLGSLLRP